MQHEVLSGRHCEQCAHHSQLHSLAIALAALLDQGHHLHSTITRMPSMLCYAYVRYVEHTYAKYAKFWTHSCWQALLLLLLRCYIGNATCIGYQAFACHSKPTLDHCCTRLGSTVLSIILNIGCIREQCVANCT